MNKDNAGNVIFILLVFSSLILLSIRFEFFIEKNESRIASSYDNSIVEYSVTPTSIVWRLGIEDTKKILDKNELYYVEIAKSLKSSISTKTDIVGISEDFYKNKKSSKSIQLNFEPEINQRLLYRSLFLEEGEIGNFEEISEILIPQIQESSIYFKTNDGYYEMKKSSSNNISSFENFSNLATGNYYSLKERFPVYTNNDVLISDSLKLESYKITPVITEKNIDEIGRIILGLKYDFANKIAEIDGSFIITYDYGREIIKVRPDGKVYYKGSISETKSNISDIQAQAMALGVVSQITKEKLFLSVEDVFKYQRDGNTFYDVLINQKIDGVRVSLNNDKPTIKVTIANGKIYILEAIFVGIDKDNQSVTSTSDNGVIYLIEKNLEYINQKEPFDNTLELFDKIKSAEYAYVYEKESKLISCYKMIIGDSVFFFRIDNAEVVKDGF